MFVLVFAHIYARLSMHKCVWVKSEYAPSQILQPLDNVLNLFQFDSRLWLVG